jgi:2-polyprenyl-3-methyl-5-hydroxy-6-metoxy-1,4-benzoquinol methylase
VKNKTNTLGNTDQIYNAYMGELGSGLQESTRERFHWQAQSIKGEKILDIGCSQGLLPILLAREGKKVVGIDIFEEAIKFANNLKSKEISTTQKNITFIHGDFLNLNIKETFDTIILGETLEHFYYPEKIIKKLLKNLKNGGRIIITVPFGINDYYDHRRTYYLHDLLKLISGSFILKEVKYSEIRNTNNWIGIIGEKTNSTDKNFNCIDKDLLKNLEKNIYKNERRLINTINQKQKEVLENKNLLKQKSKTLLNIAKEKTFLESEYKYLKNSLNDKILEIDELSQKNKNLNKKLKKFKNRKIIKLINLIKNPLKYSQKIRKKIIRKLKSIIKKLLKYPYSLKSKIIKNRLEHLVKEIPDSNGSSLFQKTDLNIAIITDEFMFNYYKDAVNLKYINSDNYKKEITSKTDIILFISCWFGLKNNDWKNIYKNKTKQENLFKIFNYGRQKGAKIVFQTIEDPSNYDKFLPIAKKADYIFTSDKDKIGNYVKDTKNSNVFFLEYGINPFLHNPIGCNIRHEKRLTTRKKIFFAGSWAERYKERCRDAKTIFNGVIKARKNLIIADRNYNVADYPYPFRYQHLLIPPIEHTLLQKIHKLFDWNINVNSIKYSTTMCAMRVYELQALGSLILSNYAISVYNRFPNIFIINNSNEVKYILNGYSEKEKYQMKVKSIRNVYSNNTVFDRLSYISNKIGLKKEIKVEDKLLVVCDNKTVKITNMYNNQIYKNKNLIEKAELKNINIDNYNYVTFFSNSNNYSEYYLEDMMNCFKFVDVPYVTKGGYFNNKGRLIGTTHNYVNSYKNEYQTIFNLKKITLNNILLKSPIKEKGYSSDPFELNEQKYSIKNIDEQKELGVIVPVYNNGEFLYGKAFLSLRRSSIFNKMHILLVDDGSSDTKTKRTVRRLAEQYPNISTYFFPEGGSGSASRPRNKGIEILNTKYICFFDPDDEVFNKGYSKLLKKIRTQNYDFIFGFAKRIFKGKHSARRVLEKNQLITKPKKFLIQNNFFNHNVQSCIFKRSFLIKNNLFFLEEAFGEDSLFFLKIMICAKNVYYLDIKIFQYYNDRINSAVNNITLEFFKQNLLKEKEQIKILTKYNLLEEYKNKQYHYFLKNWYNQKLEILEKQDLKESIKILKEIAYIYGYDIEKSFTKKYLKHFPITNNSSYYKKFDFNIAIVTDNLAYNYFDNAINLFYIGPNNYKAILDKKDIDLFLFTTCWTGMKNEDWRGITSNKDIRNNLIEIFKYCKSKNIPTVYWSKEDPPHYDVFHEFSNYADYIFTTARECIPDYKIETKNENVYLSQYGINPFIHNPIGFRLKNKGNWETLNNVIFAGSWYSSHKERSFDQEKLFDGVINSSKKLIIFDRNYFNTSKTRIYPEKYLQSTYPPIEYSKLQKFHKLFDWALNLNIVKDSKTMCAARVFELQAQGIVMISNPSLAVERNFPNIFITNSAEEVTDILNNTSYEEIYKRQLEGIRNVYTDSTVFERLGDILYKVGLIKEPLKPKEIIVICEEKTEKIEKMFNEQIYQNKKLIDKKEAANLETTGFIAFFSEKYNYGIHYLQDMINGFKYTNTAFITKDTKVEHNYVNSTKDKYRTIFNPEKIDIKDILNKTEFKEKGYSIDPFEI